MEGLGRISPAGCEMEVAEIEPKDQARKIERDEHRKRSSAENSRKAAK